MNITTILAGVLALSLLGNAFLSKAYLDVRDERTAAQGERDDARSAASACSDATEALEELAGKRKAEAEKARAAAAVAARGHLAMAQHILSTPATVPGDACKSADERINRWLAERKTP